MIKVFLCIELTDEHEEENFLSKHPIIISHLFVNDDDAVQN